MDANVLRLPPRSRDVASSPIRPTRAEVDLATLAHNLGEVRRVAGSARVYGVVKADAYGHGLVPVARALERAGIDGLCVALAEEGLTLRAEGVRVPILVLDGAYGNDHARVLAGQLTPVVYSFEEADAFARAAAGRPVDVHVKVDTGMARLGVPMASLGAFLTAIGGLASIRVRGVLTHLSSADADDAITSTQLDRFDAALAEVRRHGHAPECVHAANSAATYRCARARHSLVRVGLALYGASPAPGVGGGLVPAMRVRTEVLALRSLPAGAPIGYGGTFRTTRASYIATLPIGYGDGLLRSASGRGVVLIGGKRCPVVGAISMDLTTVDVTDASGCAVGDEAVILGADGGDAIDAHQLASACGTIAYEVLTGFSGRLPRLYRGA
jgi:alanine racemase